MKITKLTTYQVPPRWLFLKIETDAGVTGWGETYGIVAPGAVIEIIRATN